MPIGNDIVDLKVARTLEKEKDSRFLSRVFSSEEQAAIALARDSALTLWMIWAAKESLFKIASQRNPEAIFSHAQFKLDQPTLDAISAAKFGPMRRGNVYWECTPEYVHCVIGEQWKSEVERTRPCDSPLSEEEEKSIHSSASRQVRLLAKKLMGSDEKIVRRWDSNKFLAPEAPGFSVSLSHDGEFVAAAVAPDVLKPVSPARGTPSEIRHFPI